MNYGKTRQFKDMLRDARVAGVSGKVTFTGTVKLHGTNAGVRFTRDDVIPMSRNSDLVGTDNAGFAAFVESNIDFSDLEYAVREHFEIAYDETIKVFGEWAGPGIQKGVGINLIPEKQFFVFAVCLGEDRWFDIKDLDLKKLKRIHNLHDFLTFELVVDIDNPGAVVNKLKEFTEEVEKLCPVTMELFGYPDVDECHFLGEGIVWSNISDGRRLLFKTKGQRHSASKVKTVASVDPEKLANVSAFVDYAVTENRVRQGMGVVQATDKSQTGDVLRWVANDIIEEESDSLEASGLVWKDVAREASHKARSILFGILDE